MLFALFSALTALSILALVAGLIALLAQRGRVTKTVGREAGAQVMAGLDEPPDPEGLTVAEAGKSAFVGTGARVAVEGEMSLAEAAQALRERRWAEALPALLILAGFAGLFLFGALALLTGLESKLPGIVALAVAAWVIVRIGRDVVRS